MSRADWVLITEGTSDGLSRAAVAAVRALASAGYRPAVTVSGAYSLAASSRHCARRVKVHSVHLDPTQYAADVEREARAGDYLVVLPASEDALKALMRPVRHLVDKLAWVDAARAVGLDVPQSRVFGSRQDLLAAARELDYPAVVKPNTKRYPAALVEDWRRLRAHAWDDGPVIVQPYLRHQMHGVLGVMWRGRLIASTHMRYLRLWPRPCGTVASAETIAPDVELERRLSRLLAGYDGVFHADFAGPYLLDLNPRVHATLPAAVAAGANLVALYCDLVRGGEVADIRGRAGVLFRWIEGDIRSVLWSVRRGELGLADGLRSLLPRRGQVYSYESLSDPGPMVMRLLFAARGARSGRRAGKVMLHS